MIALFMNLPDPSIASAAQPFLQDAMMYLTPFSRALNQPSYWPDPDRPHGYLWLADYGSDNLYNPPFRQFRATSGFPRADGSAANVGEPLVKKRFALSRLIWLTYAGPSATSMPSTLKAQYLTTMGLPSGSTALDQIISEGTATNIQNYLGLQWQGRLLALCGMQSQAGTLPSSPKSPAATPTFSNCSRRA